MYVIAEIGINFNNSKENCFKLIDCAVNVGCSAAKFQTFSAKNLYPKSAGKLDWKDSDKEYSYDIYEAVKKFELPSEWIDELMSYCKDQNIDFISSVFSLEDLEFMIQKGMKQIKLSSYTITHIPLIEAAAKTGLPTIMSTGGATLAETEEAITTFLKYSTPDKLTILHCSIAYPTDLKDVNMGVLDTFKYAFPGISYGYSDHTFEISDAPVQAIYLGAKVIEKHITLDKKMEGPDHFFALEPQELKQMVEDIRQAEIDFKNNSFTIDKIMYGSSAKICHSSEQYLRDFAYSTLFAKRIIKKGEIIKPQDISILRPGKKQRGLDPKWIKLFEEKEVIASKDLEFEDSLTWDVVF
jgi:N-acetylneuraminate synthase